MVTASVVTSIVVVGVIVGGSVCGGKIEMTYYYSSADRIKHYAYFTHCKRPTNLESVLLALKFQYS